MSSAISTSKPVTLVGSAGSASTKWGPAFRIAGPFQLLLWLRADREHGDEEKERQREGNRAKGKGKRERGKGKRRKGNGGKDVASQHADEPQRRDCGKREEQSIEQALRNVRGQPAADENPTRTAGLKMAFSASVCP